MPAFSGLYDGVHGDGFTALREQSRPPMLRGLTRVLMQKRGMHGTVHALGRTAPLAISQIDAERGSIDVIGGMEAWPSRDPDAANKVTITNISSHINGASVSDRASRVPDATEDDLAHSFDTTLREGFVADEAISGVTSPEVVANPTIAPV